MKHTFRKALSLLLAACCLFGTVGCAAVMERLEGVAPNDTIVVETKPAGNSVGASSAQEKQTAIKAPAVQAPEQHTQVSDEQIMDLYWDLFDEACSASENGDYEMFKSFYYDTDESVIQNDFGYNWRQYDEYDRRDGFVAGSRDGYYWIVKTHYIVSGTYPNYRRNARDGYSLAHYENGNLQFAYGEEATTILNQLSIDITMDFFEQVSPGFKDSINDAANFASFINNNYLFLNGDLVYKGSYDVNLVTMWQMPNGDVKLALIFTNGTNQNISSSIRVTVTDDALGTVIDEWLDETVATRANHSQVRMFTIPASSVKTGMQTWGSMQCDVHTDNK